MRKKLFFKITVIMATVFITQVQAIYSQDLNKDTLYFCKEYKDGKEIGNNDAFYITKSFGYITVMLRTVKPIGVSLINLEFDREVGGERVTFLPCNVDPDWTYIFISDVIFDEPGKYKVSAVKKNGEIIASAYVNMLLEK